MRLYRENTLAGNRHLKYVYDLFWFIISFVALGLTRFLEFKIKEVYF